ncbi:MAG: family 78 glycoside hydrolase catalytic domain [Conexibacter sp.]
MTHRSPHRWSFSLAGGVAAALALAVLVTALLAGLARADAAVGLETNATATPLGIDTPAPRLGWQLSSTRHGAAQTSYRILVATSATRANPGSADVWDSGRRTGSVPWADYGGPTLSPFTRYWWTVRVWNEQGEASAWAPATWFETAFTSPAQWSASWITRPVSADATAACEAVRSIGASRDGQCPPSPILRDEFTLDRPVASARLYASGLGWAVYHLNGQRVGALQLSPGSTRYDKRLFYTTSDVTSLLRQGANALGVELGRGYYGTLEDGLFTGDFSHASWHDEPKLRLELRVTFTDGTTRTIASDPSWRATTGPTLYDNLYRGETYDGARAAALAGWTSPGYDDSGWQQATLAAAPQGTAQAIDIDPDETVETLRFRSLSEPQPGVYVLDLGRNISGVTRLRVQGQAGAEVQLLSGSDLNADGTVAPATDLYPITGNPENLDVYRLAGTGAVETYAPQFTYRGFQYVQVTGWPGATPPTLDDFDALAIRAAVRSTGDFGSSSTLLDRIYGVARDTFLESAHDIPVGDPNSEKAGWTGDGMFVTPSWMWLFDTRRLHAKWVRDMRDSQAPSGELSEIAPGQQLPNTDIPGAGASLLFLGPTPSYDAALFEVAWDQYVRYGDLRPLTRSYDAMQRYLAWVGLLMPTHFFPFGCNGTGDCAGPGGIGDQRTPGPSSRNAWPDNNVWLYRMETIAARTADLLGHAGDALLYRQAAADTRTQFNAAFLDRTAGMYRDPSEAIGDYSQYVNAVALQFGLVPDDMRATVAASLAGAVADAGDHLNTGATGTIFLWPALSDSGHVDEAVRVATQTTFPSYGHWLVEQGSTVLREDWEGGRPEMFKGSIVNWLFEDLAGIQPLEPGFAKIRFRPAVPTSGLDAAHATYDSVRGTIASSWQRTAGGVRIDVTVPPDASGVVCVPATSAAAVTAPADATFLGLQNGSAAYAVGAGAYTFVTAAPSPPTATAGVDGACGSGSPLDPAAASGGSLPPLLG